MKCFLPLVQEREAKIPALVWEAVARAAAAPPPLPPCLSVVLRGKSDRETRFNYNALSCIIFSIYFSIIPCQFVLSERSSINFVGIIFSCFTPKVPSDMNFNALTCSTIDQSPALQISATLPATAGENLSFPGEFQSITGVLFLIHFPASV